MTDCEIIVVGGGSAGCILAHALTTEYRSRITLVEAPSCHAPAIDRNRPARWLNLLGSGDDWDFETSSVPNLSGRVLRWPRGRGIGGSSRINAMIWFPPTDGDLNEFAQRGGWSSNCLRNALQDVESIVKPESPRWLSESSQRFVKAAESIQNSNSMVYRRLNDRGRRWNPAELIDETKVQIVRASVERVIFDGDRACGVQFTDGQKLNCRRQVVLCAGAIGTPMILMRSGIGPRDVLLSAGIDVRHSCENVGNNLQDHLVMPVIYGTRAKNRFDPSTTRDTARWQTVGAGPIASNLAECGGLFLRDRLQVHITPTHYLLHPSPHAPPAMTIAVNATKPKARGQITITNTDPNAPPCIRANYLDDQDLQTTIDGVRLARQLAEEPSLAQWISSELLPGAKRETDASLARSIRRYAQTLYHPVGSCQVGTSTDDVVDPQFDVRSVDGLKIADASVFPSIPTGNPNAMVMMLARLAGKSILNALG